MNKYDKHKGFQGGRLSSYIVGKLWIHTNQAILMHDQ